jgi:hypothetical protein
MTYSLEWRNAANTILARIEGNHTDIIEPGNPDWDALSKEDNIAPFVAPLPDLEGEVRAQRNALLSACDWTQLADAPVDDLAWAVYRQALRDIPDQPGFPANVVWPVAPS